MDNTELGSSGRAHALFRLALTRLHPDSPVRDDERAIELLEGVVAQHPGTATAVEAQLLLRFQRGLVDAGRELAARQEAIDELRAERLALQEAWGKARTEAADQEEKARRLAAQIGRVEAEADELRDEIRRREDELRRLKAIDLGPPGGFRRP